MCFITAVQRLGKSCIPVRTPSLLMRLITRVTSLDTSTMLLKPFPRSGFSNFRNSQSLVVSCQDCTSGGEALAIHTFPKFPMLHLRHEAAHYRAWLESVSSSISRLHFAEQRPRSLRYRTQCALLTSGSQLLRKSGRLHHPTGHASAVCRTFEMTYVNLPYLNIITTWCGLWNCDLDNREAAGRITTGDVLFTYTNADRPCWRSLLDYKVAMARQWYQRCQRTDSNIPLTTDSSRPSITTDPFTSTSVLRI
jgi:hypothetical protein